MWHSGYFRLFLSHTSAHRMVAGCLRTALLQHGVSLFVAHEDIESTTEWRAELEHALEEMDGMVALLTADIHASNWTDHEIGYAFGARKVVLPVTYAAVPYGFLAKFQGLPLEGNSYETMARQIAEHLIANPRSRHRMSEALTVCLRQAKSAIAFKRMLVDIQHFEAIAEDVLDEFDLAIKANVQLKKAKTVCRMIEEVIDGHRLLNQA